MSFYNPNPRIEQDKLAIDHEYLEECERNNPRDPMVSDMAGHSLLGRLGLYGDGTPDQPQARIQYRKHTPVINFPIFIFWLFLSGLMFAGTLLIGIFPVWGAGLSALAAGWVCRKITTLEV
jgi:hypothetical protein